MRCDIRMAYKIPHSLWFLWKMLGNCILKIEAKQCEMKPTIDQLNFHWFFDQVLFFHIKTFHYRCQ